MEAMKLQDVAVSRRYDYPTFVVFHPQRGYLQERAKQWGWHWETTGRAWYTDPRYATKYPRTVARLIALERGGAAVEVERWSRRSDSNRRPAVYETAALPTELHRHRTNASTPQPEPPHTKGGRVR
jgi:hypothetical protein